MENDRVTSTITISIKIFCKSTSQGNRARKKYSDCEEQ